MGGATAGVVSDWTTGTGAEGQRPLDACRDDLGGAAAQKWPEIPVRKKDAMGEMGRKPYFGVPWPSSARGGPTVRAAGCALRAPPGR